MADQHKILLAFRDTTTHSDPKARREVEGIIMSSVFDRVVENALFYRVCAGDDIMLNPPWEVGGGKFVSACRSIEAARFMLRRPPSPFADRIVELRVTGGVIYMGYDDAMGRSKSYEEEVLVPLSVVECVKQLEKL